MTFSGKRTIKISRKLDLKRLPRHMGIILDGNGRWATKRRLPRNIGHKAGCENLKRIVRHIYELGIKYTTFFMFSTENWKRPKQEVDGIFDIVREYLHESVDEFVEYGVKIVTMGDASKLPEDLYKKLMEVVKATSKCDKLVLNLAINYGGRDEILRAVNLAIADGEILNTVTDFQKYLYTSDIPDPDFIIRTSGEMRVSNFMLFQMAYTEWYFTKTLWPDFTEKELQKCLINFQNRKRRFGALNK